MIDLKAFLIFYCMCRQANKEYEKKRDPFPGRSLFNDLGWRPLLKAAISRTVNWFDKKKAVLAFHDEFASFTMK